LNCSWNNLANLDLPDDVNLEFLDCTGNKLTNLDLPNNDKLIELHCSNNNLISLDLSKNVNLAELNCSYNQLINLDVSNNLNLNRLDCSSNQLTELNLPNPLPASLTTLSCQNNQLTSLSDNLSVFRLDCRNNQLTFSDLLHFFISGNTRIIYVPQDTINLDTLPADSVDLTKEFKIIDNDIENITTFKWFENETELIEGQDYENNSGMFVFADEFIGKTLICKATNSTFNNFTLTFSVVLDNKTSINETQLINLVISPNPANEKLTINYGENVINEIELFDISGKLLNVYNNIEDTKAELNISHLQSGVYFLKIDGKTVKFVKE
jgi:hypothetical protein